MLTGAGKVGYMVALSGMLLLVQPLIRAISGKFESFDLTLSLVGTVLMKSDPNARSLWRQLFWSQALSTRKDRIVFFLIVFGTSYLLYPLRDTWKGESLADNWPYFSLALLALLAGWFLALSEFWQSRSPQK
jgi:hypothetical protein